MTARLRYWIPSAVLALTVGLLIMLLVTVSAEPLALHLAGAAGGRRVGRILTPALVTSLARYSGIAAFLGCVGIAIDVERPLRRS